MTNSPAPRSSGRSNHLRRAFGMLADSWWRLPASARARSPAAAARRARTPLAPDVRPLFAAHPLPLPTQVHVRRALAGDRLRAFVAEGVEVEVAEQWLALAHQHRAHGELQFVD